jgi:hypothetical protein
MTQMKIATATPLFSLPPDAQHFLGMNEIVPVAASIVCSARQSAAPRCAFSILRAANFSN